MKNLRFLFLGIIMLAVLSCSGNKAAQTEISNAPSQISAPVAQTETTPTYTRLPLEYGNALLQEADGLEGTFYNSGKSISLWADNVKSILSMMTEAAPLKLDNNIIGHVMFLKKGEKMAYVEISMKNGNNYVIYTIDDKKFYNTLNANGVKFFEGMNTQTVVPAVTK